MKPPRLSSATTGVSWAASDVEVVDHGFDDAAVSYIFSFIDGVWTQSVTQMKLLISCLTICFPLVWNVYCGTVFSQCQREVC